jgi:hypothetical protein
MKAKQTMDVAACDALDHAIGDFAKMYIKEWTYDGSDDNNDDDDRLRFNWNSKL